MAAPAKLVPSLLTQLPSRLDRRPNSLVTVEPPTSPSAAFALSRFEFENGKGNEGTKILMVEWDTSASPAAVASSETSARDSPSSTQASNRIALGDWEVSWEGKTTVLPQLDMEAEAERGSTRRVYFLLPPGAAIPPLVTISQRRRGGPVLRTKPMPAIFTTGPAAESGTDESSALGGMPRSRPGVLHTLWAKSRLSALAAEVEAEMKANGESVGLQMALQERQWIMDHFALDSDGGAAAAGGGRDDFAQEPRGDLHMPPTPRSPTSPRGRLGEKLRGLKLATSPFELAAALQAAKSKDHDVAVSSFASYPGPAARPKNAENGNAIGSLNASVSGGHRTTRPAQPKDELDTEDLFALPMSPRSPEMKKSPFSLL